MKKLAVIAAGALLLGAAGWSALWVTGRGAVGDRLDAEIAQLRAQGYGIEHGAREIGGFPFGYRVTYRDVAIRLPGIGDQPGGAYYLPELVTEVMATDVDRVVTRFPPKFRLEIPVPAETRAEVPDLPERFAVDIEAEALVADINGLLRTEREIAVTARSVLMVTAGPKQTSNIAIEMKGVDFTGTLPRNLGAFPASSASTVDRIEYAFAMTRADQPSTVLEGALDAVRTTGQTDITGPNAWIEMFAGGTGSLNMAYQSGASSGTIRTGPDKAGQNATVNFAAGSTAGTVAIADGQLRLDSASQANRFAVSFTPKGASAGGPSYGGALRAIELGYAIPLAPRETMSPLSLRFALDQITLDPALWTLVDPAGTLPHDPARLVIDVEASARLTARLDEMAAADGSPFEIGTASIRAADLTALGAAVTARGDVAFPQPLQQPVGKITVTLTNAIALLTKLSEAGLVEPAMAQTAILMATGMTKAGAGPGVRTAEIELTPEGVKVNGVPLSE